MSTSSITIMAGAALSAAGAILLGIHGSGLVSGLEAVTWSIGQTTSGHMEQVVPAFAGGAMFLMGLASSLLGVHLTASKAVVSLWARISFLIAGFAILAAGWLFTRGMGSGYGLYRSISQAIVAPRIADIYSGLAEITAELTLGGWLVLLVPAILIAALTFGTDPSKKPLPAQLWSIVPAMGAAVAAIVALVALGFAWNSVGQFAMHFGDSQRQPQASEIVSAIDNLLFAGLLLGATVVLVALPTAMMALGMSSNAEEETAPLIDKNAETLVDDGPAG